MAAEALSLTQDEAQEIIAVAGRSTPGGSCWERHLSIGTRRFGKIANTVGPRRSTSGEEVISQQLI